jgi:hypothetical protein
MMSQTELEQLLIRLVREHQEASGYAPVEITPHTRPLEDVPGFDSVYCVQTTVAAAGKLHKNLDFLDAFIDGRKSLTIAEAAKRLLEAESLRVHRAPRRAMGRQGHA